MNTSILDEREASLTDGWIGPHGKQNHHDEKKKNGGILITAGAKHTSPEEKQSHDTPLVMTEGISITLFRKKGTSRRIREGKKRGGLELTAPHGMVGHVIAALCCLEEQASRFNYLGIDSQIVVFRCNMMGDGIEIINGSGLGNLCGYFFSSARTVCTALHFTQQLPGLYCMQGNTVVDLLGSGIQGSQGGPWTSRD